MTQTVKEALDLHLDGDRIPSDGGYEKKWVPIKVGFFTVYIYNSEARKQAVRLHDIHHIVTGYKTNLGGEAEISAWELAAGIHDKYFAGLIGFPALVLGAYVYPKRTFNAFILGKYSRSLYSRSFSESLLAENIATLKSELLPKQEPKAKLSYVFQYVSLVSLPIIVFVLGVVILAAHRA